MKRVLRAFSSSFPDIQAAWDHAETLKPSRTAPRTAHAQRTAWFGALGPYRLCGPNRCQWPPSSALRSGPMLVHPPQSSALLPPPVAPRALPRPPVFWLPARVRLLPARLGTVAVHCPSCTAPHLHAPMLLPVAVELIGLLEERDECVALLARHLHRQRVGCNRGASMT